MPRVRLTDLTICNLPPSENQITYWDEGLPAFGVRVGARRKTFIVITKPGHRIKLGNYPFMTLKDARREAHKRLSDREGDTAIVDADVVEKAVTDFIDIHHARSRPRWRSEQKRLLTNHFVSKHKGVSLNKIKTKDVLAVIDDLVEVPSEQLHCYRALKKFFSWHKDRKTIAISPLDGVKPPSKQVDRERVLSDKEIVAIYRAAQTMAARQDAYGFIVLIIFHTAFRPSEAGGLRRSYVTAEKITLPEGFRTKKKGGELVLPNLIGGELRTIPNPQDTDYYFPNAVGGPFSAWGEKKKELDELCGVNGWQLRDIRRTVRTKLSEWGCCDDATAERVLGHVSGETDVGRIYNKWKYFPQKKAALEAYERKLEALISAS